LKHPYRHRYIPQPSRPQVDEVYPANQTGRRLSHENLNTVPGGHHPRRTIEHRTAVVPIPRFGLAGCDAHAHRQLQLALRGYRRIDS
jgi:hypothetical protein